MKILFITDAYPRTTNPNQGVFVYNFVQELVKQGHTVNVVAFEKLSLKSLLNTADGYGQELATVHRYKNITAGAIKLGRFNTYQITFWQKVNAVKKTLKRIGDEFDVVYCHFIESAIFGLEALKNYDKPVFVAVGENRNLEHYFQRHRKQVVFDAIAKVTGFIAVSEIIKGKLIHRFNVAENKIVVRPNATDLSVYKPLDKIQLRNKHGFPSEDFIVIFIGRYLENKGPLRVLEAVKDLPNLKCIFVGEGPQNPHQHEKVIFNSKVPRNQIPELLNCADVFVLPTQHEGSNNAIVEAMACGLPIVSSDIPEVRVQCTADFSILVDPMNISAIRDAILAIKNDPERAKEMSKQARLHSQNFDLSKRAENIISFMQSFIP